MPLQKRRLGKSRIHHRRSFWMHLQGQAARAETSKCSHCGEHKLAHRVCEACGYYGGHAVIEVAQESSEE